MSNKETLTTQKYLDYLGLSRFITDSLGVCIKNEDKLLCETIQNLIQKHHLMIGKTVYIGDTAQDIKSANQAHVQTCAVTWEHNLHTNCCMKILIMLLMIQKNF